MLKILRSEVSVIYFFLVSAISFVLTLFSSTLVPSQFTRDSELYANRIASAVTGYQDSYQVVATFYRFFGITQNNLTLKILEWLLFFFIITIAIRIRSVRYLTISTFFTSSIYLLLIPFYGSVLTKETFIGIFLIPYLLIKNAYPKSNSLFLLVLLMMIYAVSLRDYYFITLFIFIFYKITSGKIRSSMIRGLSPILLLGSLATLESQFAILRQFSQEDIFNIRMKIQMGLKFPANSKIVQERVDSSFFHNIENYSQIYLQMVFPYNLLQFSVYSIATFIIVVYISTSLTFAFIRARDFISAEVIFLFSYFVVALIFEPDLGSYVRHSFPFLALVARNAHSPYLLKNSFSGRS